MTSVNFNSVKIALQSSSPRPVSVNRCVNTFFASWIGSTLDPESTYSVRRLEGHPSSLPLLMAFISAVCIVYAKQTSKQNKQLTGLSNPILPHKSIHMPPSQPQFRLMQQYLSTVGQRETNVGDLLSAKGILFI
ncbi:hypothetical protein ACHAWO_011692 [Cyclotella atomus]|uniref:LAGLIDADG homing endonuclease n=1 Tax=Cyclotella atomus TaxID=382360 RepID=A0ABD3N9Y5_9STRA